jgi:intergrase/recombinase
VSLAKKRKKRRGNQYAPFWADWEVELVRKLRDSGMRYQDIASRMDIPIRVVRKWCRFEGRCAPARERT